MNPVADYLANISMDDKATTEWTYQGVLNIKSHHSFQVFTDGGRRNGATASAAWAIFVIIRGGFKLIGAGSLSLHAPDSFRTETPAIEAAFAHLCRIRASMGSHLQLPR